EDGVGTLRARVAVVVDELEADVGVVQRAQGILEWNEGREDLLHLARHRRSEDLQRVAVALHGLAELVHRAGRGIALGVEQARLQLLQFGDHPIPQTMAAELARRLELLEASEGLQPILLPAGNGGAERLGPAWKARREVLPDVAQSGALERFRL